VNATTDAAVTADKLAILDVIARWAVAGDTGDRDTWLQCFTADGTFRRSDAEHVVRGREELGAMFGGYPISGRHFTSNHIVEVSGDSATHTCYLLFLDRAEDFAVHMVGVYHDELTREAGVWRIRARVLEVDFCK
jgi:hypothetical protein